MIGGSALVVYITTYVVGVKCELSEPLISLIFVMGCDWVVYEPPASRFACRVPLLLTQKGEGRPFPLSPTPSPETPS